MPFCSEFPRALPLFKGLQKAYSYEFAPGVFAMGDEVMGEVPCDRPENTSLQPRPVPNLNFNTSGIGNNPKKRK